MARLRLNMNSRCLPVATKAHCTWTGYINICIDQKVVNVKVSVMSESVRGVCKDQKRILAIHLVTKLSNVSSFHSRKKYANI